MAAYPTPAPGSKFGPCVTPCEHRDCAASRRDAEAVCSLCKQPIGYDRAWCHLDGARAHELCAEEAEFAAKVGS